MLRVIEHSHSHIIQKVCNPRGQTLAYQAVPRNAIGDSSAVQRFLRLHEARKAANVAYAPPQTAKRG